MSMRHHGVVLREPPCKAVKSIDGIPSHVGLCSFRGRFSWRVLIPGCSQTSFQSNSWHIGCIMVDYRTSPALQTLAMSTGKITTSNSTKGSPRCQRGEQKGWNPRRHSRKSHIQLLTLQIRLCPNRCYTDCKWQQNLPEDRHYEPDRVRTLSPRLSTY